MHVSRDSSANAVLSLKLADNGVNLSGEWFVAGVC